MTTNAAQQDRVPRQPARLRRAIGNLGNLYVPYAGAVYDIDLGAQNITTTGLGTFGDVLITSPVNIYLLSHNSFVDFVADEHVAHSGVTLTAGIGLSGGGTIAASRTFDLDILGLTTDTIAAGDWVPFHDLTDAPNKIAFSDFEATLDHNNLANAHNLTTDIDHDTLTNYVADQHVAHSGVTITTGDGLTGGGDITANRTFAVDYVPCGAGVGGLEIVGGQLQVKLWAGEGLAHNANGLYVTEANVDHNALNNYDGNEHIDHTGVTLTAGVGISGGGTIAANRSFALDILGLTTDIIAADDWVPFHDLTDAPNKLTFANFEGTLDHDNLANTHNLTSDISHDSISDVSANDHHAETHALESHTQGSNKVFMTNEHEFTEIALGAVNTFLTSGGDGANLTWTSIGNGLSIAAGVVQAKESEINHDALNNYDGNDHIDHTTVTISGNLGISGGGTLAASRILTLDIVSLTTDTIAAGDWIPFHDLTDTPHQNKITFANFEGTLSHDALADYVVNKHIDWTGAAVGVSAGADTDTQSIFGRARVGYGTINDYAWFSHYDMGGAGQFALVQSAAGRTVVNAAAGQPLILAINNAAKLTVNADGTVTATGALDVAKDTDVSCYFGRCLIGGGAADVARFSHHDLTTSSNYGFQQSATGYTYFNCATGAYATHRVNNVEKMRLDTNLMNALVRINTTVGYSMNSVAGLSATYTFGGGGSGEIATMTFAGGILTGVTTVP